MAGYRNREVRRSGNYIYGNAVRKEQSVPYRRKKDSDEHVQEYTRKPNRYEKEQVRIMRRNTRISVAFMVMAGFFLMVMLFQYLHLRGDIALHASNITSLESDLVELRSDNKATRSRISAAEDIEHIKKTAMKKFGMTYPKEDQIVTYTVEESDYMYQYQGIPEVEEAEEELEIRKAKEEEEKRLEEEKKKKMEELQKSQSEQETASLQNEE